MATQEAYAELIEKIMNNALTPEQEQAAVESCARARPNVVPSLLSFLVAQKQRFRSQFEESESKRLELLKTMQEPPWHLAVFLYCVAGGRAMVIAAGRQVCVGIASEIDLTKLRFGGSVLLNGVWSDRSPRRS